ncbi:MAG: hypothetical protein WCD25_21740 [Pseudolabrys sp.]
MACLLRETGTNGTVIAIDTFLGSPEHWDRSGRDGNLMPCKNGRPLLYEQFLTNVVRTGMQDFIVPLPRSSEHAVIILSRLGIRAGLVHAHFLPINAPSTRHVVDMASADDGKCASLRFSSFFDAAHEYEPVMRDVRAYWELLEPGGYLVGDGYVAVWPDVIRVAHECPQSVNQPLTVAEPKWILQKPQ